VQAASDLGLTGRLRIAFLTGASLRPPVGAAIYVEAAAFVAAAAAAAWLARRGDRERAAGALVVAIVVLLIRLAGGSSYVPGLLAATPLAIAGLALGRRVRGALPFLAVAVLGFLAAVATQFPEVEPNGYQWGGRYVLVSGALLAVVGVTALEGLGRRVVAAGVAVSVAVSGFGVAFLVQRTHHIGDWARAVADRPEAVVISRVPYAFRDAGSRYTLDSPGMLAADPSSVQGAFDVAAASGATTVALIEARATTPVPVTGWCRGVGELVPWDQAPAVVAHYDRADRGTCPAPVGSSVGSSTPNPPVTGGG
jgi:hypothetical protein